MHSPHANTSVSNSSPVPATPALSNTPPQTSAIFAATSFTSPSPKSVVPKAGPNPSVADYSRYYYADTDNRFAPETAYHRAHHIASTIAEAQPLQPATSYLPRTSSLLPPPRVSPDAGSGSTPPIFQNPFNAQPIDSVNERDPPPLRRPSRSSSAGGLSDSFRNLNRWSASTTSSRASPIPSHRKNTSASSRRVSVDVAGSIYTSPRKLQKHRQPSQSDGSPRYQSVTGLRQESISLVPPLESLPRIATLPSLEQELQSISPSQTIPATQRQAFTREASDDISAVYWDGPVAATADTTVLSAQIGWSGGEDTSGHALRGLTMPYTQNGESRGHSRSRSTGAKGSADTTSSRGKERDRSKKQPSQKAMLSKALQKANTAVQLDNAQNPEGAREAYSEACDLLQQVLQRTGGEEDRKKLEAIVSSSAALNADLTNLSLSLHQRKTYTSRIDELDALLVVGTQDGKALPRRPSNSSSFDRPDSMMPGTSDDEDVTVETATVVKSAREQSDFRGSPAMPSYSVPIAVARRHYNNKTPQLSIETSRDDASYYLTGQYPLQSSFSKSPRLNNSSGLQPPMMDSQYMPPPLSPRRPPSPAKASERDTEPPARTDLSAYTTRLAPAMGIRGHQRVNSHESVSWLDPIEESGGSAASSVHSRSSSLGVRRKHIRAPSGETEAEFDAALDDAIEAAYNDGYEPDDSVDQETDNYQESTEDAVAKALRRVEIARERVRETEREALILANEREKRLRLQLQEEEEEMMREEQEHQGVDSTEDFYDGNDSEEEEERLLEEMTKEYAIEEFAFGAQKRPSIPRQSDSSGLTSRTWHSSMGSNPPTATTILTTVSESTVTSAYSKPPTHPAPAPTQALPQLPPQPLSAGSQSSANSNSQGVRSRRLSGQNAKQLKIETSQAQPPPPPPATAGPTQTQPKSGGYIVQQRQALSAGAAKTAMPFSARPAPSPAPGAGPADAIIGSGTPPLPSALSQEARAGSPSAAPPVLRKNFSSSSLRSMKSRNISVSNIDDASDLSPGTPLSNQYGLGGSHTRLPAMPSLPTPIAVAFKDRLNNASTGGLYLFDVDIHSPREPGSPNSLVTNAPVPLEPCPSDVMLRPFWLMRCIYQTLCHPRGGYLSNKLFVPRDVWRVKGVKLRNVEDKISSCDYLTAALQKLAQVDSTDADAVLEEMQTLENVLEQVQASLTRKLGNEVGVSGASNLFKEANAGAEGDQVSAVPRSASISGKSGGGFWSRRLRTKTSSAGLGNAYTGKGGGSGGGTTPVEGGAAAKDMVLPSLPMTSTPTSRPAKRDVASVQFGGPNGNYMSALAKLFDAAQTVGEFSSFLAKCLAVKQIGKQSGMDHDC
jgi:hypothetical protein